MSVSATLFSLLLLSQLCSVSSIYFHVHQGAQRCFLEEMPGQTLFLATYKNPDYKPWGTPDFNGNAVVIRVLDPSGAPIFSRVADVSGKVAFHSVAGGEYQLCFNTNGTRYVDGAPQKFVRAPPLPPHPPCAACAQALLTSNTHTHAHSHRPCTRFPLPLMPPAHTASGLEAGCG
jgi:hypothetical protein